MPNKDLIIKDKVWRKSQWNKIFKRALMKKLDIQGKMQSRQMCEGEIFPSMKEPNFCI